MPDSFENPFAIRAVQRRSPLATSLRGLAFVVLLFVGVVVVQSQTRQWLLHRWASGLSELPVGEQIERLLQINQLGDLATETIVCRIGAEDDRVATAAVDLIKERQSIWATRDDDALASAHRQMLVALESIVDDLPATRVGWVTQLLNQTVIECVDQRGDSMKETYRMANDMLARVADRTGLSRDEFVTASGAPSLVPLPVRIQTAGDPLVPSLAQTGDRGWNTDESQPLLVETAAEVTMPTVGSDSRAVATVRPEQTVHRVDANPVSAGRVDAGDPTTSEELLRSESVRFLTNTPLQTFDTKSVIGLLASKQAATRDQAVEELVRRGLSNEEIRIANQLAAPQLEVRLGLLDSIVRRSDIDPRPWLLWLAEDPSREVRLRAIGALESMNDAAVTMSLRKRMAVETDPMVMALLQQLVQRR